MRGGTARELDRLGVQARRSMGQNFLVDERIADRHVALADVRSSETVLEIGPGLGVLTRRLAARARHVIAIEKDRRLARSLEGCGENVEVVSGDALRVPWPRFDAMVSNLPYRISSPITFRLLAQAFGRALLMFQQEFAERLVATPGTKEYSRLTVSVAHRAATEVVAEVPRSAFYPVPKVDSAIVRISPRPPGYRVVDESLFQAVVNACFAHRRKTVGNSLELEWRRFDIARDRWRDLITSLPDVSVRAETLSPERFASIANAIARAKG